MSSFNFLGLEQSASNLSKYQDGRYFFSDFLLGANQTHKGLCPIYFCALNMAFPLFLTSAPVQVVDSLGVSE